MKYGKPVNAAKKMVAPAVRPVRGKSAASKGVSAQVHAMGGRAWGASKKAANAAKRTAVTPVAPGSPSLPASAAAKAVAAVGKPKKRV